jgi:hypothetical protein
MAAVLAMVVRAPSGTDYTTHLGLAEYFGSLAMFARNPRTAVSLAYTLRRSLRVWRIPSTGLYSEGYLATQAALTLNDY